MVQFIQNLFLSPFLIVIVLGIVFLALSWWSLKRRREYIGYGLGWLIGVFGMVVYGALVGEPDPVAQGAIDFTVTLNLFQVLFPSFIGISLGAGAMSLVRSTDNKGVQNSIVVAMLTALSLWVLFLMLVSSTFPATQRMIGLFALAFGIGALTMMAIFRQSPRKASDSNFVNTPDRANAQGIPSVPADENPNRIRERIRRR